MTTSELISHLQKQDPEGNLQVVIDGSPIHFVSREVAYWDGCLHVPITDPMNKFYNIIGWEITSQGEKIRIHCISLEDAINNDSKLNVNIDRVSWVQKKWYQDLIEKYRKETLEREKT